MVQISCRLACKVHKPYNHDVQNFLLLLFQGRQLHDVDRGISLVANKHMDMIGSIRIIFNLMLNSGLFSLLYGKSHHSNYLFCNVLATFYLANVCLE